MWSCHDVSSLNFASLDDAPLVRCIHRMIRPWDDTSLGWFVPRTWRPLRDRWSRSGTVYCWQPYQILICKIIFEKRFFMNSTSKTGWCLMKKMYWICKTWVKFGKIFIYNFCKNAFGKILLQLLQNFTKILLQNFMNFCELNFNLVLRINYVFQKKINFRIHPNKYSLLYL
jgi:hypothetical protein